MCPRKVEQHFTGQHEIHQKIGFIISKIKQLLIFHCSSF